MSEYTPTEAEDWLVDGFVRGANYAPADKIKAEELIESVKAQVRADERAKRPDREQLMAAMDKCRTDWEQGRAPLGSNLSESLADVVFASLALEPEAREEVTDE